MADASHPRARWAWPRRALAVLGAGLLTCWAGANAYAAVALAHGGKNTVEGRDPASVGLRFSDVSYGDGRSAWHVPGAAGRPVVVVVHGYGNSRSATLEVGPPLHELGYGLLFVNLGYVSTGGPYGGGQREADDVADAVAWVGRTLKLPVVLLGFSAGALAALSAVASGAPVAAVVSDSGFVGFRDVVAFRAGVRRAFTAPLPLLYPLASGGSHLVDLGRQLRGGSFRAPTLVVQGTADETVSPSNGRRIARLTGGRLWLLPGVGHADAFHADRLGYVARVDQLIRAALPGSPASFSVPSALTPVCGTADDKAGPAMCPKRRQ